MDEGYRSATKRAFLVSVGTAYIAGCLENAEPPNEVENGTNGNTTGSNPEPEPEPEPEEPTLFIDADPREEFWDRGESWQDCESLDGWELLGGSLESSTRLRWGPFEAELGQQIAEVQESVRRLPDEESPETTDRQEMVAQHLYNILEDDPKVAVAALWIELEETLRNVLSQDDENKTVSFSVLLK